MKKVLNSYFGTKPERAYDWVDVAYSIAIWMGGLAVFSSGATLVFARPIQLDDVSNALLACLLLATGLRGFFLKESGEANSEAAEFKIIVPVILGLCFVNLKYIFDFFHDLILDLEINPLAGGVCGIISIAVRALMSRRKWLKREDDLAAGKLAALKPILGNPEEK